MTDPVTDLARDTREATSTSTSIEVPPFTCPRCSTEVTARFYGPCDNCRRELRVTYAGESREIEVAEYEPKMNVTPNAVALKDD